MKVNRDGLKSMHRIMGNEENRESGQNLLERIRTKRSDRMGEVAGRNTEANPYGASPGSLIVKLQGPKVKSGKILLADLHIIADSLNTSIERYVMSRVEGVRSLRPGERGKPARELLQLYLTDIRSGSSALKFQLTEEQRLLEASGPETELLVEFTEGIGVVQETEKPVPAGFDRGVLQGINMMKPLFNRGIDEIQFIAKGTARSVRSSLNPSTSRRIDTLLLRPSKNQRSISGIILEADFSAPEVRFELFTQDGDSVVCTASEDDLSTVLSGVMQHVRITGDAEQDPETGKILRLRADNIEFMSAAESVEIPYGQIHEFWSGTNLDELVERQGIVPFDPKESPDWEAPTDEEAERYLQATKKAKPKTKRIESQ